MTRGKGIYDDEEGSAASKSRAESKSTESQADAESGATAKSESTEDAESTAEDAAQGKSTPDVDEGSAEPTA